jgi:putative tryptophan/tyrosine transport system substrate-binding protein
MKRRDFITLLGGAAAWPLTARAQQPAMPVIGFLSSGSPDLDTDRLAGFRRGLSETGHVESRNVAIEYRWAEGQYDRLPALAADLVRRQVAVIATDSGVPGARAAKAATTTIPIVFNTGVDPVAFGLVASLARPGGNLTGVTSLADEVGPKRLELMHELVPAVTSMALLVNPTNPNAETQSRDMQAAARTLGLQLNVLHATTERDFDAVFAAMAPLRTGALIIGPETYWRSPARSRQLAALAARLAIPAIYTSRDFVASGGLMSYGAGSQTDPVRLVGVYTGRILKGENPADLPVQQSTNVELIINMKAAKALGLTVPLSLRGRANELIE